MSTAPDSALHYPLGERRPTTGEVIELAPGVRWLRMPLPFALDHINLWLLRDRDEDGREGWTVVDCGVADARTRAAWERVFASGLDGLPLLRVVVTHMHPDHIGLADWLGQRWRGPGTRECRLWISATDWNAARLACLLPAEDSGFGGEAGAVHFRRHGLVDEAALQRVRERGDDYRHLVPAVPKAFRRLLDGMRLRIGAHDWRCIAGYGHAPEHMALHCEALGLLISGDMVLPRISANIGVIALEPEADPLPLYMDSLRAMRALPADTLVLPSHGLPFTGLRLRLDQLLAHHEERLAETLAACAEAPLSAAELLPIMFRRELDTHQTLFAMGEAIAHLHALAGEGKLVGRRGEDGVIRFALPG